MRGIHWIIFLSSVFALTLGVSASTASFGKSSLGCIDYCTVEEYAKINATQQYWFYMAYGWMLLAFVGLAGIMVVSIWVGLFQTRTRFETHTSKYGGVNDQLEPG